MATIEVKVPDIGDFKDVAVIELLVKPGDRVAVDQSLITRLDQQFDHRHVFEVADVGDHDFDGCHVSLSV